MQITFLHLLFFATYLLRNKAIPQGCSHVKCLTLQYRRCLLRIEGTLVVLPRLRVRLIRMELRSISLTCYGVRPFFHIERSFALLTAGLLLKGELPEFLLELHILLLENFSLMLLLLLQESPLGFFLFSPDSELQLLKLELLKPL